MGKLQLCRYWFPIFLISTTCRAVEIVAEQGTRKEIKDNKVTLEGLFESVIAQKEKEGVGRVTDEDLIKAVAKHP